MLPWETLQTSTTPDGAPATLSRRGEEFALFIGGHVLMTSREHDSEVAFANLTCDALPSRDAPRVLVGGLGFGFTLRAALDRLGPRAEVRVVELLPALIEWNRGPLSSLSGSALTDRRVTAVAADVRDVIKREAKRWDAILLDVDNGPFQLSHPDNAKLYSERGLASAYEALAPAGVLSVWSAAPDPAFARRLEKAGFTVEVAHPPTRKKRSHHVVFIARRRGGAKPQPRGR